MSAQAPLLPLHASPAINAVQNTGAKVVSTVCDEFSDPDGANARAPNGGGELVSGAATRAHTKGAKKRSVYSVKRQYSAFHTSAFSRVARMVRCRSTKALMRSVASTRNLVRRLDRSINRVLNPKTNALPLYNKIKAQGKLEQIVSEASEDTPAAGEVEQAAASLCDLFKESCKIADTIFCEGGELLKDARSEREAKTDSVERGSQEKAPSKIVEQGSLELDEAPSKIVEQGSLEPDEASSKIASMAEGTGRSAGACTRAEGQLQDSQRSGMPVEEAEGDLYEKVYDYPDAYPEICDFATPDPALYGDAAFMLEQATQQRKQWEGLVVSFGQVMTRIQPLDGA